jgi:hypothetical protein
MDCMPKISLTILLVIGLISCSHRPPVSGCVGEVLINEFVSTNKSIAVDEDKNFNDWIELYNCSSVSVDLSGWGLSNELNQPFKWVFKDSTIQPKEYLIIWASGKDSQKSGLPLQTNFKISSNSATLMLTRPNSDVVDRLDAITVPTDRSYGRYPDGHTSLYYFDKVTPGQQNLQPTAKEILSPPVFSMISGFYDQNFNLSISHPDPSATIYYTLDGSIPDPENLQGSTFLYKNQYRQSPSDPAGDFLEVKYQTFQYLHPLLIQNRSSEPDRLSQISTTFQNVPDYFPKPINDEFNVKNYSFKGMNIRAIAVKKNAYSSEVVTHNYFIAPRNIFTLPVVAITVPEKELFDFDIGIMVAGRRFEEWRDANPKDTANPRSPANWQYRGKELASHFQLYSNNLVLDQIIGIRLHGGWSRANPLKSLRLYARNDYGKNLFDYPIFSNKPNSAYKSLILRNSGNDGDSIIGTLFRDAAIQRVMDGLGFSTQAYQPVVLFINAEYYGILNFREHYSRDYFARLHGIDKDRVEILAVESGVKIGESSHWDELIDLIETQDIVQQKTYHLVCQRIDIGSFIDYHIANIFINNGDWPTNNIRFWRYKNQEISDKLNPKDGRWRWLMFDTDFGFGGNGNHKVNTFLTSNSMLLHSLFKNQEFKYQFINRFADLLNSHFQSQRMTQIIDQMQLIIEPELTRHINRWSRPSSIERWNLNVDWMRYFVENRPASVRGHILDFFTLEGLYQLDLNVSDVKHGYIRVNSLSINEMTEGLGSEPFPWSGQYFKDVPIELEAIPNPGYRFSHWSGFESSKSVIGINPKSNFSVKAIFVKI